VRRVAITQKVAKKVAEKVANDPLDQVLQPTRSTVTLVTLNREPVENANEKEEKWHLRGYFSDSYELKEQRTKANKYE